MPWFIPQDSSPPLTRVRSLSFNFRGQAAIAAVDRHLKIPKECNPNAVTGWQESAYNQCDAAALAPDGVVTPAEGNDAGPGDR